MLINSSIFNSILSSLPDRYSVIFIQANFVKYQQITGIIPVVLILLLVALIAYKIIQIYLVVKDTYVYLSLVPPQNSAQSSSATSQLFSIIHDLGKRKSLLHKLIGYKTQISLETYSSKELGIRYLLRVPQSKAETLKHIMITYAPNIKMEISDDYMCFRTNRYEKVIPINLTGDNLLPLNNINNPEIHDPVAYITGMMTKLLPSELLSFQIVLSPVTINRAKDLKQRILHNEDILVKLNSTQFPVIFVPLQLILNLLVKVIKAIFDFIFESVSELRHGYVYQNNDFRLAPELLKTKTYNLFEQRVISSISEKLDSPLFEASIRFYISSNTKRRLHERTQGFLASLSTFTLPGYQSLKAINSITLNLFQSLFRFEFVHRLLPIHPFIKRSVLSSNEISSLFHFPFINKTEDLVTSLSGELPAPLSLKQTRDLDVVFAQNSYGGKTTQIGLTKDERKTHMFVLGRTGSGKTTLLYTMARHDIEQGNGLAFIDPHGDVSEELIATIPLERKHDFVYLNPYDISYPVGINLLELTLGLNDDQSQLEKELVTESVISLFKKIFTKDENTDSHRIEYILRNTIYTAFTVPDRTIFTIYELLNNPSYRKQITKELTDDNLRNFWKHEFGKAGSYQVVKMAAGVTAKIGRFLFSPIAKRILEQPKSTINFDDVLNGKILICNLSQGKLGEDTAKLLGTTILTKIQQAAMKRAFISQKDRKQFHLYVDEFQNFATTAFTKILSEGRKYGLDVIMAEQSVSQQDDPAITNVTLSNVTTVVCFRTGNPKDEELMLAQFAPTVKPGDISNLPPYHFYIHISAGQPQLPFSGQTIIKPKSANAYQVSQLIQASRDRYATFYASKPVSSLKKSSQIKSPARPSKRPLKSQKMSKSLSTLTG